MFKKKEILIISLVIILFAVLSNISINLLENWKNLLFALLSFSIVILGNIFAKKIAAFYLDSEIEIDIWRTGKHLLFPQKQRLKNFPTGAILPVIIKIIFFPFTAFFWMASLIFEVSPRIFRGARRHGLYTFSEITEYHIGLIAASGIITNLIFSIIGYFLGFPLFSRLNIYYAFFNMLPISELDGNKIFFGSRIIWSFLASLILIGMLFAIFIV